MSKSLGTLLLAAGAFAMVAIGAAVIVMTGLGDGEGETVDGPAAATASEQHVYLMNLGMGWRSCAGAVAAELDLIDGVIEHDVDFEGDFVELRYNENQVSIEEIEEALAAIGYRPASHRPVSD